MVKPKKFILSTLLINLRSPRSHSVARDDNNNMKIIVGLGNPGTKYALTRHNVGFMVADQLAKELGLPWQMNKKFNAEIAKGDGLLLAKPQTFMNLSGEAVRKILSFYKLLPAAGPADLNGVLTVIHDDIDVDFGKCKTATDSRAAGHNGIQSIIDHLHTQKFTRYRFGVRTEERNLIPAERFVLQKFNAEELEKLPEQIMKIVEELSR